MSLAVINEHPRDSKISFQEEGHIYTIKGKEENPVSVTTLLKNNFPEFDADLVIDKMMKSSRWPQSKYYGQTKEEIKAGWDANGKAASEAGTLMHADIENFLNGEEMVNPNTKEISYFHLFWNEFNKVNPGLKCYRTEWIVYFDDDDNDKFNDVSGSIDGVLVNEKGQIVILDWKRSKEIKKENPYEKGTGVFSHLDNCNYWKYALQLNIYRHILESKYDKEVIGMYIVVLHPDNKCYETHFISRYDIASIWDTLRKK